MNQHVKTVLPTDSALRKQFPLHSGCMAYFPNALLCVSHQSWLGNQQHNPGEPLHWAKEKSADEPDAGARHSVEGELVAKAWRALAELERALLAGYKPWPYLETPKDSDAPPEGQAKGKRYVECKCGRWNESLGTAVHHSCSACGNTWLPFRSFTLPEVVFQLFGKPE